MEYFDQLTIKRICQEFLTGCTGWIKSGRGYAFNINGQLTNLQIYSSLFHYKGMSELCIKALKEKWGEDKFSYEVEKIYLEGKKRRAERKFNVANTATVNNIEQTTSSIDDELREALVGYGKLANQIIDDISPVLKKFRPDRNAEDIKKLELANREYAQKLGEISDFFYKFYKEIFKGRKVIDFSSKFLKPFDGFKPIAEILNFYGVPEIDNKTIACQFNYGLRNSGLAYKIKNCNSSEWSITHLGITVAKGSSAAVVPGRITNFKLDKLDEDKGNELYFNFEAFCCYIDYMRQTGTINFDVMNALGIWNKN